MDIRFIIYMATHGLINLYSLYYLACFNIIYEKSSDSWIQGCFMSLAIDIAGIQIVLPLIQALLRLWARKVPLFR